MAREEDRQDDRGRSARRMSVKEWLQIAGIALACAAIVWRGGEMTEKLETVGKNVSQVQNTVDAMSNKLNGVALDVGALQVRAAMTDKEIGNHETRITRIEHRGER